MAMPHVPPEIWRKITSFLRNPLPPVLSDPDRSEIQQPHLVEAGLVSKLFKSFTDIELYTHITTDCFPHFLVELQSPSKSINLARMRTLRIEYCRKGIDGTYKQLMLRREETWVECGLFGDTEKITIMEDTEREVTLLAMMVGMLAEKGMSIVFPRLHTIVVGSLYVKIPVIWVRHREMYRVGGARSSTIQCNDLFERFLATGALREICIRDPTGPLSLNPSTHHDPSSHSFLTTVHFDSTDYVPLSFGRPMRIITDIDGDASWSDSLHALGTSFHTITALYGYQQISRNLQLDVYCSTSNYGTSTTEDFGKGTLGSRMSFQQEVPLPEPLQEEMVVDLGNNAQRWFRSSGRKDIVRWHRSIAAPTCGACGARPPKDSRDEVYTGGRRRHSEYFAYYG